MRSCDVALSLATIEESFFILIRAFASFEKYIVGVSIEFQLRLADIFESSVNTVREETGVRLLTTLGAGRSYVDVVDRIVSHLQKNTDTPISQSAKGAFGKLCLSSAAFRIGAALRNHALHNSPPLSGFSLSGSREWMDRDFKKPSRSSQTLDPTVSISKWLENGQIPMHVRGELTALGKEYIDLKMLLKGFVQALVAYHQNIRVITHGMSESSMSELNSLIADAHKYAIHDDLDYGDVLLGDLNAPQSFKSLTAIVSDLDRSRTRPLPYTPLQGNDVTLRSAFFANRAYLCPESVWV